MKSPVWVDREAVLAIHDALLSEFGGAPGVRDDALLDSSLTRARNLLSDNTSDMFVLAAAYIHGIVRNHPFVDGNKRTGFVAGGIFLERNGKTLRVSEEEAAAAMLALAEGTMKETALAVWLRKHCR